MLMRWTLRWDIRAISEGSRGGMRVEGCEGRSSQGCGVEEFCAACVACAAAMRLTKESRSSRARVVLPEQG